MLVVLLIPFGLQALAMFFDEFYFHRKRGLPLWERIGHPIDSLSVLACYGFISIYSPSTINMMIYVGLCSFSCLLITKDEFVHTEHCEALENWLHSVLFVLHPITFLSTGYIWNENLNPNFIAVQPFIIFAFMLYQIIYWSNIWKPLFGKRQTQNPK